ncbi:MAG: hypothetical protein ACD_72C00413G0003, partial [uncultured bacterium]
MPWLSKSKTGASLIEFIVGFSLVVIFSLAIYGLANSGLKLINDDQNRSTALGLARQQMEQIKNLPYDDVGTVNGVPSGTIEQTQTTVLNGVTFTIRTNIQYIDDTFDDVAPLDTLNTDYKKVRIRVTWDQGDSTTPVALVTNIVPTTIESTATGGTLFIEVFDPTTDPVEPVNNAEVTINAPTLNPPIAITDETDNDGRFILPGATPGIEAYEITVTKPEYSTDQTYTRDLLTNPNPNPAHLNVLAGEVTTAYFEISRKVNLLGVHLNNYDTHDNVVVDFQLHGEKTIGTDGDGLPIYKYNQTITPNEGGNAEIHGLEPDLYTIIFDEAAIGYVLAGNDHPLPFLAQSGSADTIELSLAPYEPYTALLTITDQTEALVPNASVTLTPQSGGDS